MGNAMSLQAVANALVGGLALGPLTARVSERGIIQSCLLALAAGFLAGIHTRPLLSST
jgi:hypothetical protein